MSKEMICKNCKYHYIEELSFDYPQSCCRKRSETTEKWYKCNDFEYGDRYIEQLQNNWNELKNWCKENQYNDNFDSYQLDNYTTYGVILKKIQELESGDNDR